MRRGNGPNEEAARGRAGRRNLDPQEVSLFSYSAPPRKLGPTRELIYNGHSF
ncbi:hypothetical protein X777_13532 [Ooceraea biroi]|uniref:Uncharacterized protein n=1 Tax=Ooceraea biroi TaxID=2015173 RepID=A0A026WX73_OOCBI|nr:hypothetical protein X777_13532 [Ooceraea biroi]